MLFWRSSLFLEAGPIALSVSLFASPAPAEIFFIKRSFSVFFSGLEFIALVGFFLRRLFWCDLLCVFSPTEALPRLLDPVGTLLLEVWLQGGPFSLMLLPLRNRIEIFPRYGERV